jgi:hypothetical protein
MDDPSRFDDVLDELTQIRVPVERSGLLADDVEWAECTCGRPMDERMRRALREQLGYDLPDDLDAYTRRTRSISGPRLHLQLPRTPDDTDLKSVDPIGEVYQIGGSHGTF